MRNISFAASDDISISCWNTARTGRSSSASVSSDTLRDAQQNPQNYKDLVVRVAGFSAYFTRLDIGVQNEIIKRTQYNEF